jgi:molecular chaperone GrpE
MAESTDVTKGLLLETPSGNTGSAGNQSETEIPSQETRISPEVPATAAASPQEPPQTAVSSEVSQTPTIEEGGAVRTVEQEQREATVPLEEYTVLQKEKDELFNRFLRKTAEFENFRKRIEKEKQEFLDYALFSFIKNLLPVLDSLERALNAPDGDTVEDHKKGLELILKQLREVLSSAGLQPIRAIGHRFDPHYHQAILREESSRFSENEVMAELQRGYTLKDRLLRPSMVKVAVAPPPGNLSGKPIETEAC